MESETEPGASRWRIWAISIPIVLAIASIGLYLFSSESYSESEIRRLIDGAYNTQRPGGGRLSNARYRALSDTPRALQDLGKAQILLLRFPESDTRQQLQGLLYLASGNWQKY